MCHDLSQDSPTVGADTKMLNLDLTPSFSFLGRYQKLLSTIIPIYMLIIILVKSMHITARYIENYYVHSEDYIFTICPDLSQVFDLYPPCESVIVFLLGIVYK